MCGWIARRSHRSTRCLSHCRKIVAGAPRWHPMKPVEFSSNGTSDHSAAIAQDPYAPCEGVLAEAIQHDIPPVCMARPYARDPVVRSVVDHLMHALSAQILMLGCTGRANEIGVRHQPGQLDCGCADASGGSVYEDRLAGANASAVMKRGIRGAVIERERRGSLVADAIWHWYDVGGRYKNLLGVCAQPVERSGDDALTAHQVPAVGASLRGGAHGFPLWARGLFGWQHRRKEVGEVDADHGRLDDDLPGLRRRLRRLYQPEHVWPARLADLNGAHVPPPLAASDGPVLLSNQGYYGNRLAP